MSSATARFQLAGFSLELITDLPLLQAFSHLEAVTDEPDLRVRVVAGRCRGGWGLRPSRDGRRVYWGSPAGEWVLDRQASVIYGRVDPERLTDFERGRPFYPLLVAWLADRGLVVLHAALLSHQRRGVLLAGPRGAGKTTTALGCHACGWTFVAEDKVTIDPQGVVGHSLYCSAFEPQAEGPKRLRFLTQGLASRATIEMLALPQVSRQTRLTRLRKSRALLRLAPNSLFQGQLNQGRTAFARLSSLVEAVPAFLFELGPKTSENSQALVTTLASLPLPAGPA
ncbi:MAG: hypothetical protein KC910_25545 [Candidatus Eremiobacteraeota bacterium]|nr:hypothetical protein [Candidatus Eremiobacteraeota bacterium]